MSARIQVRILGGTGYVAGEVLRLLAGHPGLTLGGVYSRSRAGDPVAAAFPHLAPAYPEVRFQDPGEASTGQPEVGALVSCLPHGASAARVAEVMAAAPGRLEVVDLSADFRIPDRARYEQIYATPHGAPDLLPAFTCALPDLPGPTPEGPVAHPGCFTTAVTLACAPLQARGLAEPRFHVSAVTGSTGSGRRASATTHHPERTGNLGAYQPLIHRHRVEMEALLAARGGAPPAVLFVPHSGPFARGIHATVHVRLTRPVSPEALRAEMREYYQGTPFVTVDETPPRLRAVAGTNHARLSAQTDGQDAVLFAAIDNLVKGAAGGGLQWLNRRFGWAPERGLQLPGAGWGMSEFAVYKRLGVEVVHAEGMVVRLADGRELLDFYGGHAVCVLGHSHPALTAALKRQMDAVLFQTNLVDLAVRRQACERLAAFAPPGLERVLLVNSGAEANENALRVAFRATQRARVVALEGGFHGRTAAAGACTWGSAGWYGFPQAPFEVTWVPREDVGALEAALGDDVAAVITEPVLGVAGAVALSPEYLKAVRTLTTRAGALWIADEVQCGMGRTGRPFAVSGRGVVPDLLTTAKGLGGGFPCGALLARAALADRLAPGDLGTTFGGGPLAAAAILAVLGVLEGQDFLANAAAAGQRICETCQVGPVTAIQGDGLLLGLRCARPASQLLPELRARGVLAGGASDPDVVRLMPPLTVGDAEVDSLREALAGIAS